MKIHNVRYGFANNSSSTHSMVVLNGNFPIHDSDTFEADGPFGVNFGWEYFTVASREAKIKYISGLLQSAYTSCYKHPEHLGYEDISERAVAWAEKILGEKTGYCSVDHQSVVRLPKKWKGDYPDISFLKEYIGFVLQDKVVILGGNDNDARTHSLTRKGKEINTLGYWGNYIARKNYDPIQDIKFWTLFNRNSGEKLRISFNIDNPGQLDVVKSDRPELVDLKITDYCPYNCEFCYMGSTVKGQHGEIKYIDQIMKQLRRMKVFEVALGGGEPTMHPNFIYILKKLREYNIVPNFTSKSTKWVNSGDAKEILAQIGSFAYSIASVKDIRHFLEAYGDNSRKKLTFQYVMGVSSDQELKNIMLKCGQENIALTLLGYKTTGRGKQYLKTHEEAQKEQQVLDQQSNWVQMVQGLPGNTNINLSIDTLLAEYSQKKLKEVGLPDYFYHIKEGKFSMYIDAVEPKIGPSSYCEEKDFVQVTDWSKIEKLYKSF